MNQRANRRLPIDALSGLGDRILVPSSTQCLNPRPPVLLIYKTLPTMPIVTLCATVTLRLSFIAIIGCPWAYS
ncbi:hypothetical protein BU24DRAFT_427883 [Aaosphaeria arxii CBS 175.79]|uniref:Uncharacterized protein n=1 Tax=Aaosphaeria arxii CBS 175.79 TaxID=1450172 RepID=A0A6A5XAB6_9PLEO|nr:uncharacterized protein BU24DRAFT_427883 [Aaosphaeria arxii CBS 175.79]KAF2009853.1 hypothetical protein BU24DRAFT_427883 [Aaosphaeria arxii CBS 175.79]